VKKFVLVVLFLIGTALPAHATSFEIGFRVTTIRPTNVAVHYKLSCRSEGVMRTVKRQFIAQAPLTRSVAPTLPGADSCHIRVVAWDIRPFAHPNDPTPPFPVVTTWVNS
jgi:hypothetical protein